MKRIGKRVLRLLMGAAVCMALLPAHTDAAEIGGWQRSASVIDGTALMQKGDTVYMGTESNNAIAWRVLDAVQTNMNTDGMFLITKNIYNNGLVPFNTSTPFSNVWQGSNAQAWCTNFKNNLTSQEQNSLISITKTDNAYSPSPGSDYGASELSAEEIFFLSAEEADTYFTGDSDRVAVSVNGYKFAWWLRSSVPHGNTNYAGSIYEDGTFRYNSVFSGNAARPACNINLDSVLFASDAADGPSSSYGTLSEYKRTADTGNGWKLTLKDSTRTGFTANAGGESSVEAVAGQTIQISYAGAMTGTVEYVTALLCDTNGSILYWGDIAQAAETSGTAPLTIPSGLETKDYTLYIFNRQDNGAYKTAVAGNVASIALTVKDPTQLAAPTAAFTADGNDSGALSVSIAADADAAAYSVDGGQDWTTVKKDKLSEQGGSIQLSGVTAQNDILVKAKGDGLQTLDSATVTIAVEQAAKPVKVTAAGCTTTEQTDGALTGVDETMEYKLASASEWRAVAAGTKEVTGLAPGTYLVRVKASGATLASEAAEATVERYTSESGKAGDTAKPGKGGDGHVGKPGDSSADADGGNSPQTGTSESIMVWIVLALMGACGVLSTVWIRKKR